MKKRYILLLSQVILSVLILAGCSKTNNPVGNEPETSPAISSITADKTQILYGGSDQAVITCNASGGNLQYVWQVDLGDIVPMNSNHSKVSFTGAACCVGEKTITCTVSNSKGSVSKTIIITILEVITTPEIITIESDKTEIQSANGEKANITCYGLGGNLKYKWEADCGDIAFNPTDSSKAVYSPGTACIGTKNVKCTVSNEKGTVFKTIQIVVK